MDATRFDRWMGTLSATASRRKTLLGLALGGLSLANRPDAADARKKSKSKSKKPTFNAYGCVDVGNACRGKDDNCCSGICQGKKPKKGEKDKSHCVAHNASTCQAGDNGIICGGLDSVPCTTIAGDGGVCHTTTGNAGYCPSSLSCEACQRDRDCEEIYGLGAACLLCGGCAEFTVCGWISAA